MENVSMESRANELLKEQVKHEVVAKEEEQAKTLVVGAESELPQFVYDEKKSIDQNANDLSELIANKHALQDFDFVEEVAGTKKEAIKESAKVNKDIHLARKDAEKISALTEIDRAFYDQWELILKWGGVNSPVTKKLAIFLLCLILPFYTFVTMFVTLPIAIVKTLFSSINLLFKEISTFGKIARSIAFTLLILGAITLVVYIILFFLNKYGVIDIFSVMF